MIATRAQRRRSAAGETVAVKLVRMPRIEYDDFELKFERAPGPDGRGYVARVIRSPAGESAEHRFLLPFSEIQLENLVLKLSGRAGIRRRVHSPGMQAARQFGGELFSAVFGDEVLAMLRSSLLRAEERERGLRIQLRLQDVPELADLPWEFLRDDKEDKFFAQSNRTPIVRYLEMLQWRSIRVSLPIRVLLMAPIPRQGINLDVKREVELLDKALRPLVERGAVAVTRLKEGTLTELQAVLRTGEFHVFHFIGHGGFDGTAEEGVLVLVDDQQQERETKAHVLATVLQDHRTLRLAVLNSCEGARNSRTDPFAGVATALVRTGLPAVVAMQFEISDTAALIFATEFYSALVDGYPIDGAVAEARKAIYAQPNDLEWATPVLVLRGRSGDADRLFEFQSEPAPREPLRLEEPLEKEEVRQTASALLAEVTQHASAIDHSQSASASEGLPKLNQVDGRQLTSGTTATSSTRNHRSSRLALTVGGVAVVVVLGSFLLSSILHRAEPTVKSLVAEPLPSEPIAPQTAPKQAQPTTPSKSSGPSRSSEWRIYFDFSKAVISAESKSKLDDLCPELRALLISDASAVLLLEGYAQDSLPEPTDRVQDILTYYEMLAKRRAESVKAYLVARCDVPAGRIFVAGRSTPAVEGSSPTIQAMNRVVRILVQSQER